MTKHLVIVATHPIQYHAPLYQYLEHLIKENTKSDVSIALTVLFLFNPNQKQQGVGFGKTFHWDFDLLAGYQSQFIDTKHISVNRANPWKFLGLRLKKPRALIKSLKADVILITGWQSYGLIQATLAAKSLGIPLIIRGESNGFEPKSWLNKQLMTQYLKLFHRFLFIGSANKTYYLDRKVSPNKLLKAPYFVNNDHFTETPNLAENSSLIKQTKECFTLCFCGKLEPKKNVFHVLEAIKQLQSDSIKLIIIGSGAQREAAQAFVKTHQLNVEFMGFLNQSEIKQAYQQCDCIILPSDYRETWGLVLNEAMLHNMPAIVSNQVGSHADLIIEHKTGWIYPFGNIDALANRIENAANLYFNDRAKFSAMGKCAKQHIVKNFKVETTASSIIKAIESLPNR